MKPRRKKNDKKREKKVKEIENQRNEQGRDGGLTNNEQYKHLDRKRKREKETRRKKLNK
jgi:hypothetical protein